MIAIKQCRFIVKNQFVNALLNVRNCKFRTSRSSQHTYCIEELKNRGILEVSGSDAYSFLQGLITNDVRHLEEGSRSIYTMFLNSKGCVMYDSIVYNVHDKLYLDCDNTALAALQKHLKMFRVRRKVDVRVLNNYKVWSLFVPDFSNQLVLNESTMVRDLDQERVVPCQALDFDFGVKPDVELIDSLSEENLIVTSDPRLSLLGMRVLAEDSLDVESLMKSKGIVVEKSPLSYKSFRYILGIGEGMNELPNGNCFPLEVNCDYLHGVSFHKGCYIGQELTARVHHTGVVRKRLMPIILNCDVANSEIPLDTPILTVGEKPKRIGKLRGVETNRALGLLRISDALKAEKLQIGNVTGYTLKPHWWPQEGPKENQMLTRE